MRRGVYAHRSSKLTKFMHHSPSGVVGVVRTHTATSCVHTYTYAVSLVVVYFESIYYSVYVCMHECLYQIWKILIYVLAYSFCKWTKHMIVEHTNFKKQFKKKQKEYILCKVIFDHCQAG